MKYLGNIISGIAFIVILGIAIYNGFNNSDFWEISIGPVITLLIAIILSYYLTQRKNDKTHVNEKIDHLVYKIQDTILEDTFLSAENEQIQRTNLINHKIIANKINQLKEICKDQKVIENLTHIEREFSELREFYGEHYKDTEYMKKSDAQLKNYVAQIDNYCDAIHILL